MVHVSGPSLDQLDERGDRFAADIKRTIASIVNEVTPLVKSTDDLAIIRTHWTKAVEASLSEHLLNAWLDSADDTYSRLVKAAQRVSQKQPEQLVAAIQWLQPDRPMMLTAAFLVPKVVSRLAELFLESAINRLVAIGDLVWNTARTQMLVGMQAGESIVDIRDRIMETTTIAAPRAEVIARTEVIGASNAGSYAEMKATGLNATKEWIATEDSRTRPSHEHVDGQEVDIDEKFIVGGYAMAYPHDPAGPPQETISCRCTLGWDIPEEEFLTINGQPLAASGAEAFHLPGLHNQKDHGHQGPNISKNVKIGKKLKITHGLVHSKHEDNTIIAVTKDGNKVAVWEASKYHLAEKDDKGDWVTQKTAIKSKAYKEINAFADDWHEPVAGGDDTELPSTKKAGTSDTNVPAGTVTETTPIPMEEELIEADKPLKITDALFDNPTEYSTLAITKDGNYRVVSLNGKYFEVQKNKKVGGWGPLASFETGDNYDDIVALDKEWYTPKSKSSASKTVPLESPVTAGAPIDITQDMFNDFPINTVLAVNEDSTKRIARFWNGTIAVQEWKPEFGIWSGSQWLTDGEEASEVSKLNIKWHAPIDSDAVKTPAVNAPSTATAPKSVVSVPNKTVKATEAGQYGLSAGKRIDVDQEMIDKNYPTDTIIAVTPDAKKKMTWYGTFYSINSKNQYGMWEHGKKLSKSDALAEMNNVSTDWHEPVSGKPEPDTKKVTPPASTAPPVITPAPATATPKNFTPIQKAYAQSIFGSNGVKWHSDTKKIYDSALEVSQKDPSLTMADALAIMDQSLQKKTGDPFQTKMTKFLKTKAGMNYAQEKGGSAPVGSMKSITVAAPSVTSSSVPIPKSNAPAKNLTKPASTVMQAEMDKATPPPWTQAQRSALTKYTGSSYTTINKCARGTGPCTPATLATINSIKAAMKPSTQNVKLYRKTNLSTFGVSTVQELEALAGKTIRDNGVVSTSITEGTWSGQVHLKIEAPAGSKMAWVQPISQHPGENEFVLAPGTDFEVISVTPHFSQPSARVMTVRIVPGSGTP